MSQTPNSNGSNTYSSSAPTNGSSQYFPHASLAYHQLPSSVEYRRHTDLPYPRDEYQPSPLIELSDRADTPWQEYSPRIYPDEWWAEHDALIKELGFFERELRKDHVPMLVRVPKSAPESTDEYVLPQVRCEPPGFDGGKFKPHRVLDVPTDWTLLSKERLNGLVASLLDPSLDGNWDPKSMESDLVELLNDALETFVEETTIGAMQFSKHRGNFEVTHQDLDEFLVMYRREIEIPPQMMEVMNNFKAGTFEFRKNTYTT